MTEIGDVAVRPALTGGVARETGDAINSLPWARIPITRQRLTSPVSDDGGSACFRVIYYLKPGSSSSVADPVVIA